jgi:hypothetical protein
MAGKGEKNKSIKESKREKLLNSRDEKVEKVRRN